MDGMYLVHRVYCFGILEDNGFFLLCTLENRAQKEERRGKKNK
jgi:hypothetical protein